MEFLPSGVLIMSIVDNQEVVQEIAADVAEATAEQVEQLKAIEENISNSTKVQDFGLSKAESTVKSLKEGWGIFLGQILNKLGDTPENREWLLEQSAVLQTSSFNMSYHGIQLMEMFNWHINGGHEMDLGALFIMNDHMRGFQNYAAGLPQNLLNVYDPELAGSDDPRWSFDALPVSRLQVDPQNARIPVKVETFTDIMYGYLEMFRFQRKVGDRIVTFMTGVPGLRIKDNYVSTNAIYRWIEVDSETVKSAWHQGRSIQKKNIDYVKAANPIEDTNVGSPENADEKH